MSPYLSESSFTSPPEGFGEVEGNGKEQSEQPAEWALVSPSNTAWPECCRGNWKRKQMGPEPSGYFPGILDFFVCVALDESVCRENKSDESRK